ncbi:MAG: helix-turn-helix domain-containing protein [Clostridia bacterium]
MGKNNALRRMGLFPKLFLTMIIITIIPIVISSVIIFQISTNNLENEINRSNLDVVNQLKMTVDSVFDSTSRLPAQIVKNKTVQSFLSNKLGPEDEQEMFYSVFNVLDSFLEDVGYIEEIGVYSYLNNDIIYSRRNKVLRDASNHFTPNYMNRIKTDGYSIWFEPNEPDIFGQKNDELQLVEFVFESFNRPLAIIIVKIKNYEFYRQINLLNIRDSGQVLMINEHKKIVVGDNKYFSLINYGEGLIGTDKEQGYKNINNILASYTSSRYNNWKYVALLPADEIEHKFDLISTAVLTICLFFSVLSVLLSFAFTRNIYNPISAIERVLSGEHGKNTDKHIKRKDELGRINREVQGIILQLSQEKDLKSKKEKENVILKQQMDENVERLKNYFIYRVIYGDILAKSEIEQRAAFLTIPIKGKFITLLIEYDIAYEKIIENLNEEEQVALFQGMKDIISKAFSNVAQTIAVFADSSSRSGKMLAVLNFNTGKKELENFEELKLMCSFMQNLIKSNFKFTVTVAAGNIYQNLEEIQKSYIEASNAMKYRFVVGNNSILFKSEIETSSQGITEDYYYRKHFKNCLQAKNIDNIITIIKSLKTNVRRSSQNEDLDYTFKIKDILNIIAEYLNDKEGFVNEMKEISSVFMNFESRFSNMDEVIEWLIIFVSQIFSKDGKSSTYQNKIVVKALEIIEEEYNKNIGLSYICEKLNISEAYFSKLFKEESGRNFKDYLTLLRIEKAKEFLNESALTISEISYMVGYNNYNQFSKMFKKYEGIPPHEYRETKKDK